MVEPQPHTTEETMRRDSVAAPRAPALPDTTGPEPVPESSMKRKIGLGRRIAAARFLGFFLVFIAISAISARYAPTLSSILVGFDIAAAFFLASLMPLTRVTSARVMRSHVHPNDADRRMLLVITVAVTAVIMTTVAGVLSGPQQLSPTMCLLVVSTLGLSWLFSNSVYALHYAHLYYHRNAQGLDSGGLIFPGATEPDYSDFVYFSFTIGMTFQTSDVQISARQMRAVVTYHALAAFAFDIGVLAFAINVLGSSRG
jgi:uncharacterized membrane protein